VVSFTLFHDRMKCDPRLFLPREAGQSRRKRGEDQRGTHLFGLLIFSILHGKVDMAQDILHRIRIRQIEWKERHQRVVLNLSITSCENASEAASFVRNELNVKVN